MERRKLQRATWLSWDEQYRLAGLRDWELLPATNLGDVVLTIPDLQAVSNIVELGCGRGLRSLVMVLTTEAINRRDVHVHAIDHSPSAIQQACMFLRLVNQGTAIPPPFDRVLLPALMNQTQPEIRAEVSFECVDIFYWLPRQSPKSVDLLIDWMCFHEIDPQMWEEYASLVGNVCRKYFLLNTFSVEGATVIGLGQVAGANKYQHSEQQLLRLFGAKFEIVAVINYAEDLNPIPRPSDGLVAAKRTYLFRLKCSS
jgi:SAM-dependent methyltransferase